MPFLRFKGFIFKGINMLFEFSFYSSLLLIFFVHGMVYAALLCRKGFLNQQNSDKWLSFFLVLCSLYITPWMVGFAGWYNNQPYRDILFYVPFQHLYCMGPVIFFYVQALLNPSFRFVKKDFLHFIPAILYLIYCLVMVITDKIVLHDYYFLADGTDRDFDSWYQWTGFISMIAYFVAAMRYYFLYKKLIVQLVSYADEVLFKWVLHFLSAFLLMQALKVSFAMIEFFYPPLNGYIGSWWYFFCFSMVFYYIAITGYSNSIEVKIRFKVNLLSNNEALLLDENVVENEIEHAETIAMEINLVENPSENLLLAEWKPKLWELMHEQKAYQDPELSLSQVAKRLQTNPSLISKVVNQGFEQNFNDFVNNFRIEAVKQKMQQGEHQKQTLLGIAYDCGFNSKATFNRAFKKVTGQTPKDFAGL